MHVTTIYTKQRSSMESKVLPGLGDGYGKTQPGYSFVDVSVSKQTHTDVVNRLNNSNICVMPIENVAPPVTN